MKGRPLAPGNQRPHSWRLRGRIGLMSPVLPLPLFIAARARTNASHNSGLRRKSLCPSVVIPFKAARPTTRSWPRMPSAPPWRRGPESRSRAAEVTMLCTGVRGREILRTSQARSSRKFARGGCAFSQEGGIGVARLKESASSEARMIAEWVLCTRLSCDAGHS